MKVVGRAVRLYVRLCAPVDLNLKPSTWWRRASPLRKRWYVKLPAACHWRYYLPLPSCLSKLSCWRAWRNYLRKCPPKECLYHFTAPCRVATPLETAGAPRGGWARERIPAILPTL